MQPLELVWPCRVRSTRRQPHSHHRQHGSSVSQVETTKWRSVSAGGINDGRTYAREELQHGDREVQLRRTHGDRLVHAFDRR